MSWIKKFFSLKRSDNHTIAYDKNDIQRLFDELEEVAIKKVRIKSYLDLVQLRKVEYDVYSQLTEEDINKLILMMNSYKAIEEKKQYLRGRLIKTNRALARLEAYESELPEMLKEVSMVEKRVKEYERDLFYLNEEKEELEEEREVLLNGYKFLRYSIIGVMALAIVGIIIILAALQTIRDHTWLYLGVGLTVFTLIFLGIFYGKERIEGALKDNATLQQKAVKFINKTTIHFFHNKRYLEVLFEKLGVDSAATLELYYNRYVKSKKNQEEYSKLNRQLMSIEIDIEDLFEKKQIHLKDIESLREWLFSGKKGQAMESTLQEEQKLLTQMDAFETYEETLWKEIYSLREDDEHKLLIDEKIEQYKILTKDNLDKKY